MDGGFQIVELILLAMIAAFIGLRLRSVLGRKIGHQGPPKADSRPVTKPDQDIIEGEVVDAEEHTALRNLPVAVRQTVEKFREKDPGFSVPQFLEGARNAYGMILEAFWEGDAGAIEPFVSGDVLADLKGAIEAREEEKLTVENRLLEIHEAEIVNASLKGSIAEADIRFESEIISVTRNEKGDLVEGDLSDSQSVTDIWTFERDLASDDPNWTLTGTSSE